jgi:hypothetical protein
MSTTVPISLVTAIEAYRLATQVSLETSKAIIGETKQFSGAFSFAAESVSINTSAITGAISTDAQTFISWLSIRNYAVVHKNNGVYFAEFDAESARRIASMEQERQSMETRINTLVREKVGIQNQLLDATADAGRVTAALKLEKAQEKNISEADIARLRSKNADLEQAILSAKDESANLKHDIRQKDSISRDQQRSISDARKYLDQSTASLATLKAENTKLVTENDRLSADIRAQANRGIPVQQDTITWLLNKTFPPIIMDVLEAIAPAGVYISNTTGLTRMLKRKRTND